MALSYAVLNNPAPFAGTLARDPFMHGDHGRRLRLVANDRCLSDSLALDVLRQLGSRPTASVHWTERTSRGRVEIRAAVTDPRDYFPALVQDEDSDACLPIPAASSLLATSKQIAQEHGLDELDVLPLLQLAALARTSDVIDAAIVNEQELFNPALAPWILPHSQTPKEAVALLGLNLRAHGDFAVWRDDSTTRIIGASRFYRAAAFASVKGLDAWLALATARWMTESHRPLVLCDGIATRLSRSLRARDFLQVRLHAPEFKAVWDEVLFFFDFVLVQAMGALDLLARLIHFTYGLSGSERDASWRRRRRGGWVDAVGKAEPAIGDLAKQKSSLGDTVDLVAELRNAIHDAPLSDEVHDLEIDERPGIYVWGPGLIALELSNEVAQLIDAAERRGGLNIWGITDRRADDTIVLDPGLFAEQALKACSDEIGKVLAVADQKRLAAKPHEHVELWVPEEREQDHAAVLVGLGQGGYRQNRVTSG